MAQQSSKLKVIVIIGGIILLIISFLLKSPSSDDSDAQESRQTGQEIGEDGSKSNAVDAGQRQALEDESGPEAKKQTAKENSTETVDVAKKSGGLYRVNEAKVAKSADADIGKMLKARVTRHVDGDTVIVQITNPPSEIKKSERIRMLGVDTPETVKEGTPVQYYGPEASHFTDEQLTGKEVYLAFDWDLRDNYDRLLAYIYTKDGQCFNALLVEQGYGRALLTHDFQFKNEFRTLGQEAKNDKRGMWGQ